MRYVNEFGMRLLTTHRRFIHSTNTRTLAIVLKGLKDFKGTNDTDENKGQ